MAEAENWSRLSKEKPLERRRIEADRDGGPAATSVSLLVERVSGLIPHTLKRRSNNFNDCHDAATMMPLGLMCK
jgi:hypothetical protein